MPTTHTVQLTDDSDGIVIAKSGAPEPGADTLAWLAGECRGAWRYECDSAFNLYFHFDLADDAARFKERWASGA